MRLAKKFPFSAVSTLLLQTGPNQGTGIAASLLETRRESVPLPFEALRGHLYPWACGLFLCLQRVSFQSLLLLSHHFFFLILALAVSLLKGIAIMLGPLE